MCEEVNLDATVEAILAEHGNVLALSIRRQPPRQTPEQGMRVAESLEAFQQAPPVVEVGPAGMEKEGVRQGAAATVPTSSHTPQSTWLLDRQPPVRTECWQCDATSNSEV
jgi:hypothetical protein